MSHFPAVIATCFAWMWVVCGLLVSPVLLSTAVAEPRENRGATAGQFDFYVVSLSWSATFCSGRSGGRSRQCETGRSPGFVLHGLWPQYERGYPSFCRPPGREPSRQALELADGVYPDFGLARHEWRKHGTCTGESPAGYFEASARAKARIVIPAPFAAPTSDTRWSPIAIERAFAEINRGLRPDMIAVTCTGAGVLQEVRICMTRDLRSFQSCPEVDRDSCRAGEISVPAAR